MAYQYWFKVVDALHQLIIIIIALQYSIAIPYTMISITIDLTLSFLHQDVIGVIIGGTLGHAICTGIAVLGGRIVAQKISVRTGKYPSGQKCHLWRVAVKEIHLFYHLRCFFEILNILLHVKWNVLYFTLHLHCTIPANLHASYSFCSLSLNQ